MQTLSLSDTRFAIGPTAATLVLADLLGLLGRRRHNIPR
ncbi:MAG TPA: hypothetical protein DCQ06_13925 [Myxococcales bacterium]|nr:hypothetical protein [Myxococcales bacterium]